MTQDSRTHRSALPPLQPPQAASGPSSAWPHSPTNDAHSDEDFDADVDDAVNRDNGTTAAELCSILDEEAERAVWRNSGASSGPEHRDGICAAFHLHHVYKRWSRDSRCATDRASVTVLRRLCRVLLDPQTPAWERNRVETFLFGAR